MKIKEDKPAKESNKWIQEVKKQQKILDSLFFTQTVNPRMRDIDVKHWSEEIKNVKK